MRSLTAGQELVKTLRGHCRVNSRTRSYRHGIDIKREMCRAIIEASQPDSPFPLGKTTRLRLGFGAVLSWDKHVEGYRISGTLAFALRSMTPWQFSEYLGRMVDADIKCTGEGERFFEQEAVALRSGGGLTL